MSILIRGMDMPTSCEKCPFLDYKEMLADRPDWCPLVHIPPHEDAIDSAPTIIPAEEDE